MKSKLNAKAFSLEPLVELLSNNGTGVLEICWRKNFGYDPEKYKFWLYTDEVVRRIHNKKSTAKSIPAKILFSLNEKSLGFANITEENFEDAINTVIYLPLDGKKPPVTGTYTKISSKYFIMLEIENERSSEHSGKGLVVLVDTKDKVLF